jgi:hypothetical protein
MISTPVTAGLLAATAVLALAPASATADTRTDQRFSVGYREVDGNVVRMSLRASGVASGSGDVSIEPLAGDPDWDVVVTFHLADGSVSIGTVEDQLQRVFRPQACQATGTLDIPYEVVGGTDRYTGATGSGRITEHQNLVGERIHGVCQGPDSGLEPRTVVGRLDVNGTLVLE